MKKLISFILATVLLACYCIPAMAISDSIPAPSQVTAENPDSKNENEHNGILYIIEDNSVIITGYTGSLAANLAIPNTIDGYPVTVISSEAFAYCDALRSIAMPSIVRIEFLAFNNCTQLTSIKMQDIAEIDSSAFCKCTALTDIGIDDSNTAYSAEDGIIYNNTKTALLAYPAARGDITLPDFVTEIGEKAFYETDITGVVMPSVVTTGALAFGNCSELESSEMPKMRELVSNTFLSCEKLSSVDAPQLETLDDSVFSYCLSLSEIQLPEVTSIGEVAFSSCSDLKSISIPKVEHIANNAFLNCTSLKEIALSADNSSFNAIDGALYNNKLTELYAYPAAKGDIVLPETVTSIGDWAFYECHELNNIDLTNVVNIGDWAFSYCEGLATVDLPQAQTIGAWSFAFCDKLATLNLPNATSADEAAFSYCISLTSVSAPKLAIATDFLFAYCSKLQTATIPAVTTINYAAFYEDFELTSIDMPLVSEIEESAFAFCTSLASVKFIQVTSVADDVFLSCTALTDVYFYSEAPSLEETTFFGCADDLTLHYIDGTNGWTSSTFDNYRLDTFTPEETCHKVTFTDEYTQSVLGIRYLPSGLVVASYPTAPKHAGYTCYGFDYDGAPVTADITITALYIEGTLQLSGTDNLLCMYDGKKETLCLTAQLDTPENISELIWTMEITENYSSDISITHIAQIAVDDKFSTSCYDTLTTSISSDGDASIYVGALNPGEVRITVSSPDGKFKCAYSVVVYEAVRGDANSDYIVNTADAVTILRFAAGLTELSYVSKSSDANRDTIINTSDAVTVLRYCAGMN